MGRKPITLKRLAYEAGVDLDEVLVTLWDLGIDHVMSPDDMVPSRDVKRARQALGVATRRELRSPKYWCEIFGLKESKLRQLLSNEGVTMSSRATKLPPGAVSRLKAKARARGIDPLTGVIAIKELRGKPQTIQKSAMDLAQQPQAEEVFKWNPLGHIHQIKWLSQSEAKSIHFALVKDFSKGDDPIDPPGVRSENLLGSAVFRPQTAIGGVLKYPTIESSAAALLHSLVLDHAFHNGNKRTALVSMLVFLDENGMVPMCSEEALFKIVLQIAQHRITQPFLYNMADREVYAIAHWLCQCTRFVEKGERPIPWRRLRRILTAYDCKFNFPGGVGNRVNIMRQFKHRDSRFSRKRTVSLQTQVFYRDEGSDADVPAIKKIREDLYLDDIHGVDSLHFYDKEPMKVSDFIAKYRKTLYRLAKL